MKLSVAKKNIFRWTSGFTFKNRMLEKVGVAPVVNKSRESCLRWFGHIKCWLLDDFVRRVDALDSVYIKKDSVRLRVKKL
ncbi:hypothetical protein IEQ34_023146 [Dendrobium chrysotoxum]|uniref:Uncharacterized protein n=1 Tax=Dendrobium chrysotoxum TaxID=161865 RepID=A0AAV7FZY2_DENCH|nr:hypothetical protein IEQ34_023146 [Dendrobium chrysotoxum]